LPKTKESITPNNAGLRKLTFVSTYQEFTNLKSQFVISNYLFGIGGRNLRPVEKERGIMGDKKALVPTEVIVTKIIFLRGEKVLLDRDLAELYGVETRVYSNKR